MSRRFAITITLVVVLAVAGGLWHRHQDSLALAQEIQSYEMVNRYLSMGESSHALELIRNYYHADEKTRDSLPVDWKIPTIEGLTQMQDGPALLTIYLKSPGKFEGNENASLLVASEFLSRGQLERYRQLKELWQDKTAKQVAWFDLDVDALLAAGKQSEARELLTSHSFEGSADAGRLRRLAVLQAPADLKAAWNHLTEARAKDPNNGSLLSSRAQIFELTNRPELARQEYLRAVHKDPSNVNMLDQLGEFYRRHGHYVLAMETWCCGLGLPLSDALWIKSLFWSRVVYPTPIEWTQQPLPVGHLKPFIAYLLELRQNQLFWDKAAFKQLPNHSQYLATQQAAYWLRIAQALKEGKEKQAAHLLIENPFRHVLWDSDLHNALQQVVNYRISRTFKHQARRSQQETISADRHHFFRELEQLATSSLSPKNMTPETKNLLLSPYAVPSTFLAAGWLESALSFPLPDVLPPDLPEWVAFAYTQALRFNRGSQLALEFASKQKSSPPLQLLMGELKIATGDFDGGIQQLQTLLQTDSDIGLRAAWVISLVQMQRRQFSTATETILSHPRLATNIIGKETLARIAMETGNVPKADNLYQEIELESIEAKFYLARRAYEEKNWSRAAILTRQLLEEFPDNTQLHSELKKIKNLDQKTNQNIDRGELHEKTIPFQMDPRVDRSVATGPADGRTYLAEPL